MVLVCELLLQLGALLVHEQSRLVPEQWRQMNRTRILALGDDMVEIWIQSVAS